MSVPGFLLAANVCHGGPNRTLWALWGMVIEVGTTNAFQRTTREMRNHFQVVYPASIQGWENMEIVLNIFANMGLLPSSRSPKRPSLYHSAIANGGIQDEEQPNFVSCTTSGSSLAHPFVGYIGYAWLPTTSLRPKCFLSVFHFLRGFGKSCCNLLVTCRPEKEQQRTANTPQQCLRIPPNCGPEKIKRPLQWP